MPQISSNPSPTASAASATPIPYRQIRASYSSTHITVYQAYPASIAIAAVREQKLNASPDFKIGRMTWIKPSWCWMMYRSGYSTKDPRQERILALKMKHEHFIKLLSLAALTHGSMTAEESSKPVKVQWDPERGPALERLDYRSIQIGIGGEVVRKWAEEWIDEIEDVTEKALKLKDVVDEETGKHAGVAGSSGKKGMLDVEKLVKAGLMLVETEYVVPDEVRRILKMDG